MGKPSLLDAVILMDYRFVPVLIVTALLYYRPTISLSAPGVEGGPSVSQRSYSIASGCGLQFDAFRFARALVGGVLCWLAAGLLPLLAQSVHWPLIHDAPTMHYTAWRILNGAVPTGTCWI